MSGERLRTDGGMRNGRVSPVPKLLGLRGLRVVTALGALATILSLLFVAIAALFVLDSTLQSEGVFRLLVVAFSIAGVAGGAFLALALVALSEVVFKVGLTHLPAFFSRAAIPAALLSGVAVSVSAVLVLGGVTHHWRAPLGGALAPVIIAGAFDIALSAVATVYALYVTQGHRRRVTAWRARLASFRRHFPADVLERLSAFVNGETAANPGHVPVRCAAFPGVPSRPFHDGLSLPWMKELEARFADIRDELVGIVSERTAMSQHYPGNKLWKTYKFIDNGRRVAAHCARCPRTAEVLSRIPGEGEIMISLLEPGARISTHVDFASPLLTFHLGIQVPKECGIRVGDQIREWKEGHGLVLDTTYEHEAWNDSDQPRIVLLADFPHPDLTEIERSFFCGQARSAGGAADPASG